MILLQRVDKFFIFLFNGIKWVLNVLKRILHWSIQKPVQVTIPVSLVLIFIVLLALELFQFKIVVKPFDVYPELEKQGYSGRVFASHFSDEIVRLLSEKRENQISGGIHLDIDEKGLSSIQSKTSDNKEDIEIPGVGMSIKDLARYLRGLAGKELPTITGDVYSINGDQLAITVRYNNKYTYREITNKNKIYTALKKISKLQFKHLYPLEYINWICRKKNVDCEKTIIDMNRAKSFSDASLASAYITLGNVEADGDKSVEWYKKALLLDDNSSSTSASALYNIGVSYYRMKDYSQAIHNFKAAIKVDEEYWDAFLGISSAKRGMGLLEDSIQWLKKIKPDKYWSDVYRQWGLTLKEMGQYADAIEKFNEGIIRFPHDLQLRGVKGDSVRLQAQKEENNSSRLEEAIQMFENAERLGLVDEKLYTIWAMSLMSQGENQKAIERFHDAIGFQPKYAMAYKKLGDLFQSQGDNKQAAEFYTRAVCLHPEYRKRKDISKVLDANKSYGLTECPEFK